MRLYIPAFLALSFGALGALGSVPTRSLLPRESATPAEARAVGVVEGTVQLAGGEEAAPPMLSPYARRRYRPPAPSPKGAPSPRDVVVYVIVSGSRAGSGAEASVAQRNRTIIPHVTAIQAGTRVHFPNEDDVFHNLFSLSSAHPFNLGRYPRGESRTETFRRPGVVRIFCDIHSEMGAVILVLDSPYYARPDQDGHYRIAGVPEGRHRLVAWHESAGADTSTIVVTAAGVRGADFRLPR